MRGEEGGEEVSREGKVRGDEVSRFGKTWKAHAAAAL